MSNEQQQDAEQLARKALDQGLQQLPEEITAALAAARQKALASVDDNERPSAKLYNLPKRAELIWGGAIAASITALALTLSLQQQSVISPIEETDYLEIAELGPLDDVEWQMVQDLEFALWLSELSDVALAD